MRKNFVKILFVATGLLLFGGCGKKAGEKATAGEAERMQQASEDTASKPESSSSSADITVTDVPTKALTATPTAVPSATPVPGYEEGWVYKIVQSGYYNACAKWDADGNLLEEPEYTAGKQIYYNDCDEYYDNFVAGDNVFGQAIISLDDGTAHSSDNSLKITGRIQESSGFSGFGFKIGKNNILDILQR